MNENNDFDYAIIGGGLAGSVLYNSFKKLNVSVLLIDNSPEISSSLVAAGIYNPIVFKRLTKSWNIDYLLEDLNDFYDNFENQNQIKIHFKSNIFKIIANKEEKDFWIKKSNEQDLSIYLNSSIIDKFDEILHLNSGLGQIYNSGYVDVYNFIRQSKKNAILNNEYYNDYFEYKSLAIQDDNKFTYKNYSFKNIIFSEGYQAQNNPHFDKIKFKLTKGELLIIDIIDFDDIEKINEIKNYILNKNLFLLPFFDSTLNKILFKVGATYEWEDLEETITEKGKKEILDKLEKIFKFKYKVIYHKVGIRPTVIDRRPVIGNHNKHNNMFVFNGLGTKGVMIAPFLANLFINTYLMNSENTDLSEKYKFLNEINYNRFLK